MMGKFVKGSKPTRAERKAQKRAAQAVAKQAEIDSRQKAKDEKRAARAERSFFGRRKKRAEEAGPDAGPDQGPEIGLEVGAGNSRQEPGSLELDGQKPDPEISVESAAAPLAADDPSLIIEEGIRIIPAKTRAQPPVLPLPAEPVPGNARKSDQAAFDISTPEGRASAKRAQARVAGEASAVASAASQPEDKKTGTFIRRKTKPELVESQAVRGTQIRPATGGANRADSLASQDIAPGTGASERTREAVAQSFAALRKAVDERGGEQQNLAPAPLTPGPVTSANPDDVLILDQPVAAPSSLAQSTASARKVEPLQPAGASKDGGPVASGPAAEEEQSPDISENWIGLWVSEDGQAIYIEEDDDGWFAITVLQDPTTTCFSGPEYPEIQTFRMPSVYAREEIGDFVGERFTVITVPGLPDDHRSPVMFVYFLTAVPDSEGGGNRFATPDDPTNRVFIVADFELGTVNPWSDENDIEWIDPSVNYYKAPGKLDAYMARRMINEDPLN